jgi:hypothetical protein
MPRPTAYSHTLVDSLRKNRYRGLKYKLSLLRVFRGLSVPPGFIALPEKTTQQETLSPGLALPETRKPSTNKSYTLSGEWWYKESSYF